MCDSTGVIPLADFTRRAAVIDYDADYGVVYIDPSLKIVGGTWWLERANYDGLEGWVFRRKPEQPGVYATPGRLVAEHPFDDKGWQDEIELYDPQEPLRWHV